VLKEIKFATLSLSLILVESQPPVLCWCVSARIKLAAAAAALCKAPRLFYCKIHSS